MNIKVVLCCVMVIGMCMVSGVWAVCQPDCYKNIIPLKTTCITSYNNYNDDNIYEHVFSLYDLKLLHGRAR